MIVRVMHPRLPSTTLFPPLAAGAVEVGALGGTGAGVGATVGEDGVAGFTDGVVGEVATTGGGVGGRVVDDAELLVGVVAPATGEGEVGGGFAEGVHDGLGATDVRDGFGLKVVAGVVDVRLGADVVAVGVGAATEVGGVTTGGREVADDDVSSFGLSGAPGSA